MLQIVERVPYSETERIRSRANHPAPRISRGNEVIITWGAETEIRPGDLVLVQHSGYGYPTTDVLEAEKRNGGVCLATCDGAFLPVISGERVLYRGDLEIVIKGIARGAYLSFE